MKTFPTGTPAIGLAFAVIADEVGYPIEVLKRP